MREVDSENIQADRAAAKTARRKQLFLAAFERKACDVTAASKACGISRAQVYEWRKNDRAFEMALIELTEQDLDFTESKLRKAIRNDQGWAICFHLKCKGKARGWVERQELTGAGGADLIPPDVEARRETERISELMRDPDYRRIHCELLAAADRISGKNGGNGAHGGNGSGGNGSSEPCRPGEAGD